MPEQLGLHLWDVRFGHKDMKSNTTDVQLVVEAFYSGEAELLGWQALMDKGYNRHDYVLIRCMRLYKAQEFDQRGQ